MFNPGNEHFGARIRHMYFSETKDGASTFCIESFSRVFDGKMYGRKTGISEISVWQGYRRIADLIVCKMDETSRQKLAERATLVERYVVGSHHVRYSGIFREAASCALLPARFVIGFMLPHSWRLCAAYADR